MSLDVTYDPTTYRMTVGFRTLLPQQKDALSNAVVNVANNEPDLLASVTFTLTTLTLQARSDDTQGVLAAVGRYLQDESLYRQLADALAIALPRKPVAAGS